MSAYLIARVRVDNSDGYRAYLPKSLQSIEKFGGRFLARGGRTKVLEGPCENNRIVIVEFDSMTIAESWYESDEYQEARAIRAPHSTASFTLVESLT